MNDVVKFQPRLTVAELIDGAEQEVDDRLLDLAKALYPVAEALGAVVTAVERARECRAAAAMSIPPKKD